MEEAFVKAIATIANKNKPIAGYASIGIVTEVTGMTCTVEREGLPPLYDVRLNAIDQSFDNMFLIIPAIGSEVLCLVVENQAAETAIVKFTEIEKVIITLGGAKFEMSAGKFQIENEKADQKKITNDLLSALKNAIILTPSGPGKFADSTKVLFDEIKNDNNNLYQ